MKKTKYLLYAFKCKQNKQYKYWYETDEKYFREKKPSASVLEKKIKELDSINEENIITNSWSNLDSNDIQKITTNSGVCINYLKSTDNDYIEKVHSGYECDYEPMKALLKIKIQEEIMSE